MKLDKRIEEAVPAGQQLQELGMRLRCLEDGSDQVSFSLFFIPNKKLRENFSQNQDDLMDDDDRMLDRSPMDELGSQEDCDDDLDSDDDNEGTVTSEGERVIYPWMKKIHVAGVGKEIFYFLFKFFQDAILCYFFQHSSLFFVDVCEIIKKNIDFLF